MSRSELKADAAFHTFDPEIAVQVGINAAIVYRNLVFWVRHNEANRRNFHDGRYWTYNSLAAFDEQFPYLTAKQIRTALDKLIDAGFILKGNFAEDRFKRANWYALDEPICPEGQMDQPERADGTFAPQGGALAPEGKCIENRYKPYLKPNPPGAGAVAQTDLDAVWDAFPEDRQRNRGSSEGWIAAAVAEVGVASLLKAVRAYAKDSADFTRSKVSFSDNWFRDRRWQAYSKAAEEAEQTRSALHDATLATTVAWIKARHSLCRHLTAGQVRQAVAYGMVTPCEAAQAGFAPDGRHV